MRNADDNRRIVKYIKQLQKSEMFRLRDEYISVENLTDEDYETIADYCIFAPSLNAYVQWVLKSAVEHNRKRLYFAARDGYLMYKVAQIYCERFQLSIECRYLYCSRYSIRIPIFHQDIDQALEYICANGIEVTREKILKRTGLDEEQQEEMIELFEWEQILCQPLTYGELMGVKNQLRNSTRFVDELSFKSKCEWEYFKGYLVQEGMLDQIEIGFVDSGWVGTTQKIFNQVLMAMGREGEIEGYYWGLYEIPAHADASRYHTYYFEPNKNISRKVFFSNCLYEVIYTAPHGSTLRYRQDEVGIYVPILAEMSESKVSEILKREYNILQYTEKLLPCIADMQSIDVQKELKIINKILDLLMGNPTRQEAELYGSIPFSDDVLENIKQEVAPAFSQKELNSTYILSKTLMVLGINKVPTKESAWHEGSIARNGKYVVVHKVRCVLYKCVLYIKMYYRRR